MNHNCRGNGDRAPPVFVCHGIQDPQGDRQVRPPPPEGALRLEEQLHRRRVRDRIDPGPAQDLPGKARSVQEKEGAGFLFAALSESAETHTKTHTGINGE